MTVSPGRRQRVVAYLHRHPIFTLALLTPGIPEYVLGSSNLSYLVLLPPLFVFLLLVNVALYTAGALLIREAILRWGKGLASLIALGAAYGILEEGVGTATLFNPHTSAAGALGSYGHFAGVNWVFALGVVAYHAFVSIGLPIALLSRILPETRGRSLLDGRQVAVVAAILAIDVAVVFLLFTRGLLGFDTPAPLLAASGLAIAGLVAVAWWLPRDLLRAPTERPTARPLAFALLGAGFEPVILLVQNLPHAFGVPAVIDLGLVAVVGAAFVALGLRWIGQTGHDRSVIALAIGVVSSLMTFGLLVTWPVPMTLVAGVIALAGLVALYRSRAGEPQEGAERQASLPPVPVPGPATSPP